MYTQYYKIHNTEHKRYSFKTLNKYNAYINDMHFTAGDIPSCTHAFLVLLNVCGTVEIH